LIVAKDQQTNLRKAKWLIRVNEVKKISLYGK